MILAWLAVLLLTFPVSAWNSFVIYKLYGWFVIPLGAPILSWWHIWGLVILFSVITYKGTGKEFDTPSKVGGQLIGWVITTSIALTVGWFIQGQLA